MNVKKLARGALLVALAMILSYVEALFPLSFGVPGIKMGLANIVIIFALYRLSWRDAAVISFVRVCLSALLFGNFMSFAYSLSGAVLSLAVMTALKFSGKFHCAGVSVAGAVAHNAGQILAAVFLLETSRIIWYLPVLCISGVITGICIGAVAALIISRKGIKT